MMNDTTDTSAERAEVERLAVQIAGEGRGYRVEAAVCGALRTQTFSADALLRMADSMDAAAATLRALLAERDENEKALAVWRGRTQRAEAERDEARAYLSRLLQIKHPTVEPLPDLHGVCTQIDNSLAGLLARAEKAEAKRDQFGSTADARAVCISMLERKRDRLLRAMKQISTLGLGPDPGSAHWQINTARAIAREAIKEADHD